MSPKKHIALEYVTCIGIDWSDKRHAIALQESGGAIEQSWLASDPGSVHAWARGLAGRFG